MKANTRLFGEIDIDEEKIITLENGMIGFPDLRKFTLIFDKEKERTPSSIMWFQSMDEPEIAFPVMHPNEIKPDYAPSVSDEMLIPLVVFRLWEKFSDTCLEVSESMEVHGKRTFGYDVPIRYKRAASEG